MRQVEVRARTIESIFRWSSFMIGQIHYFFKYDLIRTFFIQLVIFFTSVVTFLASALASTRSYMRHPPSTLIQVRWILFAGAAGTPI